MLLKSAMTTFRVVCTLLKVAFSAALGVMVYKLLHDGIMPEWAVIITASVFGGNLGPVLADMALALALAFRSRKE